MNETYSEERNVTKGFGTPHIIPNFSLSLGFFSTPNDFFLGFLLYRKPPSNQAPKVKKITFKDMQQYARSHGVPVQFTGK